MKEIYRSFEGTLGVENREGFIVYEVGEWCECECLSVYEYKEDLRFRFPRSMAPESWEDWGFLGLGEMIDAVECGRIDGQVLVGGKWRTPRKIMDKHQDYNWRKYC